MGLISILPLITAFGLGSIVTVLVQSWLAQKAKREERNFQERKEAYIGLLEAYRDAAVETTERSGKEFGYWRMRCELVAPRPVRSAIDRVIETEMGTEARIKALEELNRVIRIDLAVTSDG